MAKIFSALGRERIATLFDPIGRRLVRVGVSPDVVTVAGTCAVLIGAIGFVTRGRLIAGLVIITLSVSTDMLDGAMARARGYSTPFGAFLDSTMDRIADAAVFGSLAFWLATTGQSTAAAAAFLCLIAGQVVSYAKARAQSVGIDCNVGIAERAERLVLIGVGALLDILGVPYALDVALWILAALSLFTVGQRIVHVYRRSAGVRTPLATAPAPDDSEGGGGTPVPRDDVSGQSR